MNFNRLLPLGAAVLLGLSLLGGCKGGSSTTPGIGSNGSLNPEDFAPEVQVQVVDSRFRSAALSDQSLGNDPVPGIIAAARTSLDIALPRLNRQEIVNSILAVANRGVAVRIVTERGFFTDPGYKPFYDQLEDLTKNAGNVEIHTDADDFPRLMHERYLIIDQSRVVTGSFTWESADSNRTIGDVVSILNTGVAAAFTDEFDQMFTEGNFGVNKRDDTVHTFLLGNGTAQIEVYFGPVDKFRDRIENEVAQSLNVQAAVEQFKDLGLASQMVSWLSVATNRQLVLTLNNIRSAGDADDNAVYNALGNYLAAPTQNSGRLILAGMGVQTGAYTARLDPFLTYATMNDKMVFADHGLSDGVPVLIDTTANFTDLGFTLNDEVMLVMRGTPLVNKYIRGPFLDTNGDQRWSLDFSSVMPPASLRNANDVKEFDSLNLMMPYATQVTDQSFRLFNEVPTGLLFGTVSNFKHTITIQNTDRTSSDVQIDLQFTIAGTTFFGDTIDLLTGLAEVPLGNLAGDSFVENENVNPDHKFMLVAPAGTYTLRTYVLVSGQVDARFTPTATTVTVGPGGARQLDLQISTSVAQPTGGSGGGGQGA